MGTAEVGAQLERLDAVESEGGFCRYGGQAVKALARKGWRNEVKGWCSPELQTLWERNGVSEDGL